MRDTVFMEFGRFNALIAGSGGFQPIRAVCDGRYKLVINLIHTDELYDLNHDQHETTNLIGSADHAAARDRLHDRLLSWMHDTCDPFRGYCWQRRPWRTDAPRPVWGGPRQYRAADDYWPEELDYSTGLPPAR